MLDSESLAQGYLRRLLKKGVVIMSKRQNLIWALIVISICLLSNGCHFFYDDCYYSGGCSYKAGGSSYNSAPDDSFADDRAIAAAYYGDLLQKDLDAMKAGTYIHPSADELARMDYVYKDVYKYVEPLSKNVPSDMTRVLDLYAAGPLRSEASKGWLISFREVYGGAAREMIVEYINNKEHRAIVNGTTDKYPSHLMYAHIDFWKSNRDGDGLKRLVVLIRGTDIVVYAGWDQGENNLCKKMLCKYDPKGRNDDYHISQSCIPAVLNNKGYWEVIQHGFYIPVDEAIGVFHALSGQLANTYFPDKYNEREQKGYWKPIQHGFYIPVDEGIGVLHALSGKLANTYFPDEYNKWEKRGVWR
jgi:hypothetical protein